MIEIRRYSSMDGPQQWIRGSQDVFPTKVTPELAAEIERLQRRSDALEIAEKALQKHLDQPEGPSMDIVREALTAIAATTAQAGEEK
jgi:hypothetical protein